MCTLKYSILLVVVFIAAVSASGCVAPPNVNFGSTANPGQCYGSTYGTKCYYKCNYGYQMISDRSYTDCKNTGDWSYPFPRCAMIKCNADWIKTANANGFKHQCNTAFINGLQSRVSTKCAFKCKSGYYQKGGNLDIVCLNDGMWSGLPVHCERSKCPILPKTSRYISTRTLNCFKNTLNVGERCEFECKTGYQLQGRPVVECIADASKGPVGKWTESKAPICIDVQRPIFEKSNECDMGIVVRKKTEPGKDYAIVNIENINVTDNSGDTVIVECISNGKPCQYEMGKSYKINITPRYGDTFQFKAVDSSGNFKVCRFTVIVEDIEKPKTVFCPKNIKIQTTKDSEVVAWKEPAYTDNCGSNCPIKITASVLSGARFRVGHTVTIHYQARDPSGNVNTECQFTVEVEKKGCPKLRPPTNGLIVSSTSAGLISVRCGKGLYPNAGSLFVCSNGKWMSIPSSVFHTTVDCIATRPPGIFPYYSQFTGDCNSSAVQNQVKLEFEQMFAPGKNDVEVRCA